MNELFPKTTAAIERLENDSRDIRNAMMATINDQALGLMTFKEMLEILQHDLDDLRHTLDLHDVFSSTLRTFENKIAAMNA